jgi:putative membrane protein
LLRELFVPLLAIAIYVTIISWLDLQYHLEEYNFPSAIVTLLGTVIGLVLAFRTNSSYARWWEARTLWGAIVNDSRTWTRQLIVFPIEQDDTESVATITRRMSLRQAAWCYALSRSLRGQDPMTDLVTLIDTEEAESYRDIQNIPNALLLRQARDLRSLRIRDSVEIYQFVELERTLLRLTNAMGGCERIKNTPFPQTYSRMVHGMIYTFALFLPFGLLDVPALGLAVTGLTLSCGFLMIERVAIYLQDPFSNRPSDTPMLALSRTIEINIRQMLGDTDLPQKMQPIDGVLS